MISLGYFPVKENRRKVGPNQFSARLLLIAVTILALVLAVYCWLPNRVTWGEIEQIQKGMSQREVLAILRAPSKQCTVRGADQWTYHLDRAPMFHAGFPIQFDPHGRVIAVQQ